MGNDANSKPDSRKQAATQITRRRKLDHIHVCLTKDVQSHEKSTGFDDVELIHNALPDLDMRSIEVNTMLFGKKLRAPLIIAGMTGGHPTALRINKVLAETAQEMGIGMGVGSQRAAIEDQSLAESFSVVRKEAPDILVIANLGAPQLSKGYGIKEARKAVEMIEADVLAIHLNPLQEAVQSEGETNTKGVLSQIRDIADQLDVPIIAKETGCGVAYDEACRFAEANVRGIDVGGAGGTSWSAVEAFRQARNTAGMNQESELGFMFRDWGIPTAVSVVEVSRIKEMTIIATGGVRNGIDVAKAIALGAHSAGVALPFLKPAYTGDKEALRNMIARMVRELRTTMYLTNSSCIGDLAKSNLVLKGELSEWLTLRGIDAKRFAVRRTSSR